MNRSMDFSFEWFDAGLLGQAGQLGHRINAKLLRDSAPVYLDGFSGNVKL